MALSLPTQNTDTLGNIFDANGIHIGAVPGSAADIGSGGITFPNNPSSIGTLPSLGTLPGVSTNPSSTSVNPRMDSLGLNPQGVPNVIASPGGLSNKYTTWISDHVEDVLFVIVGLLLVAAALFSLSGTKTVIQTATKAAAKFA
jgi:hypothetical protein